MHVVLECKLEFWYVPDSQLGHVRSAVPVDEQSANLVPLPHVVPQVMHDILECESEFWYCPDGQLTH